MYPATKKQIINNNDVENLRFNPVASSINAILGWSIESELVTAARNNKKKNRNPKKCPNGAVFNINSCTADAFERNLSAIGMNFNRIA